MDERQRVSRLRALAAELEQLPRSRTRDDLLRDVRGRAVALETSFPVSRGSFDGPSRDDDPHSLDGEAPVAVIGDPMLRADTAEAEASESGNRFERRPGAAPDLSLQILTSTALLTLHSALGKTARRLTEDRARRR
jgi:hypothetical protein